MTEGMIADGQHEHDRQGSLGFRGRLFDDLAAFKQIIAFILELYTCDLPPERLTQKPLSLECALAGAKPAAPDVGDAVALAVLAPDTRRPRQISA